LNVIVESASILSVSNTSFNGRNIYSENSSHDRRLEYRDVAVAMFDERKKKWVVRVKLFELTSRYFRANVNVIEDDYDVDDDVSSDNVDEHLSRRDYGIRINAHGFSVCVV